MKKLVFVLCLSIVGCSVGNSTEKVEEKGTPLSPPSSSYVENIPPKKTPSTFSPPRQEEKRKEERLTPLPSPPKEKSQVVKGIYVGPLAYGSPAMKKHLTFLKENGMNAVVIDMKDDKGYVTYPSQVHLAKESQAIRNQTKDVRALLKALKQHQIYTIARIVVFKDPHLASKKPEWAIHRKNGKVWKDKKGIAWVDPYRQEVWMYNVRLAKELAMLGFDEIQFDYVRFPDNGKQMDRVVQYQNGKNWSKSDNVSAFLNYATSQLKEFRVVVAADVFGLVTTAQDDMGIGQVWEDITTKVDVISPMMYPSHYGEGSYGLDEPARHPHQTIEEGVDDALQRNEKLQRKGKRVAVIRPWYQDFDYKATYHSKEVKEQIQAGHEREVKGYLLWNPSYRYTPH